MEFIKLMFYIIIITLLFNITINLQNNKGLKYIVESFWYGNNYETNK